jgi:hypothetical protein
MAIEKKVKVTPAGKYPLGNAKENKDASAYVKNGTGVAAMEAAVTKNPKVNGPQTDVLNMSVGGISKGNYKSVNPYGVGVMRGYGAATKGRKISGKMG